MERTIICKFCKNEYDIDKNIKSRKFDIIDDRAYIITEYECPHCHRLAKGVQISEPITYWYEEEIDFVD